MEEMCVTKALGLFDKVGVDKFYEDVRQEGQLWHIAAKKYWQNLYDKHSLFLDKKYLEEIRKDCFSRLWELSQIDFIVKHEAKGVELISLAGKNISKPDFAFDLSKNRFYLETVCEGAGQNPELNLPLDEILGRARRTPVVEYMERLCNAIDEKVCNKYHGKNDKGYKRYIHEAGEGGLIIAISMAKIPHYHQANNFDIDLRCIFGLSAAIKSVNKSTHALFLPRRVF